MSRKIEMTPQQASLFNQMKKLSKQANQRILRLERYAETTEPFAVKHLADYMSSSKLELWTKRGRVGTKKGMTELQMRAAIKALNRFIKEETSKVKGAKEYTKQVAKELGTNVTPSYASTIYRAKKEWKWILTYMTNSEFWDFARECVKNNYDYETFTTKLSGFHKDLEKMVNDSRMDEILRSKLSSMTIENLLNDSDISEDVKQQIKDGVDFEDIISKVEVDDEAKQKLKYLYEYIQGVKV